MKNLYRDWMNSWERRLADKDTNRQVQPFSWGLEWLDPGWCDQIRESPLETIKEYSAMALSKSEEWYAPPPMADEAFQGSVLTFRTPTPGKIQENNLARCTFFPAEDSRSAVIVVPQWNARRESHFSLCRLLARLGINAIRLTLPYHEGRNLPGAERADFMLGPNIGRTLHSTRQAVLEVRQVFNWLLVTPSSVATPPCVAPG